MRLGMLWHNNDPKTPLSAKIAGACDYYAKKYGQAPNLCYVHPSTLAGGEVEANGVEVRTSKEILPNHFWVGVAESEN